MRSPAPSRGSLLAARQSAAKLRAYNIVQQQPVLGTAAATLPSAS